MVGGEGVVGFVDRADRLNVTSLSRTFMCALGVGFLRVCKDAILITAMTIVRQSSPWEWDIEVVEADNSILMCRLAQLINNKIS